jgi:hypothetical protein
LITQRRLKELLSYDPTTGVFVWIGKRKGHERGRIAGNIMQRGWRRIKIDGVEYRASSLAWLYVYGKYVTDLDHQNRRKADDRIDNLRKATRSQQGANRAAMPSNKFGLKGVCRVGDKFQAQIKKNYKTMYLGLFKTPEEAHAAYREAAQRLHGEFACHA